MKDGCLTIKSWIKAQDMPQAIRWKKIVTTISLTWIGAIIILDWRPKVTQCPAQYERGAGDVSLMAIWRRQSFPTPPLSFDYKIVANLILESRAPLSTHLYLSIASCVNKSNSCLSFCLSLNSFYIESQRTWSSVSPDSRWVVLIKTLSVQVWIRALARFESWHVDSRPSLRFMVSILSKSSVRRNWVEISVVCPVISN